MVIKRRNILKNFTGSLIILSVFLAASGGLLLLPQKAAADDLQEKQQELKNVQKQIDQKQKELNKVKTKQRSVIKDLNTVETKMRTAEKDIKSLDSKLGTTKNTIASTKKSLEQTTKELAHTEKVMKNRIINIYMNGKVGYLEVLVNSVTFADFLDRMDMIREISRQDVAVFKDVRAQKQAIEKQKAVLEAEEEKLSGLIDDQLEKKLQYAKTAEEREKMLKQINSEKAKLEAAIDEMEEIAQQMNSTIVALMKQNGISSEQAYSGGAMLKPVNGRLTSPYGYRIHPILKKKKFHSGIDLAASSGTPIKAANDGVVIKSGWSSGYGNTVIIDHGGGITTLYAHASKLLCKVGDRVTRGQTVAKVGSTGMSTGPHLHFEVRVNGNTKNPQDYI